MTKTILIIEDDPATIDLYKEILDGLDLNILKATSAVQGFNLLHTNQVDLILLDIMLPGGSNGFDFLEQVKRDETTRSVPVLVLTNLDSEKNTSISMGAADYVVKTQSSLEEIKDKVTKLLGIGAE